MTNLPDDSASTDRHKQTPIGAILATGNHPHDQKPLRYRLTWEQALQDYEDGLITHRGLVYYSVATKAKRLKVNVAAYCKELNIHKATYYRSIGALEARKRLYADAPDGMILSMPDLENEDQEAESFTVSGESQLSDNPSQLSDNPSQLSDNPSQLSDNPSQLSDNPKMKPAQEASFKNAECTNRDLKNLKETIGTHTVAPSSLNSDGLGTKLDPSNPYEAEIKELLMLATQAGIKTNGTISRTMAALRLQRSAADTPRAVENSVSAVVEQMRLGKCKNPSAMLNASLQRELKGQGFTANEAKRNAKGRTEEPRLNEVALSISKALERHDRAWALGRLQQLWDDGYQDLIEEMLHLFKREWNFSLTAKGVRDACS